MPDHAPDGSIIITPKEFYDGVREDIATINRNVSDLREALAPLPARVTKLEDKVDALEERVDGTDRKIAWWSGFAACGGALLGALLPRVLGG